MTQDRKQQRFEDIVTALTWPDAPDRSGEMWTTTPPTTPGWYWYYGPRGYSNDLQVCHVMVGGCGKDAHVIRIIDGGIYWYAEEHRGAECWWQKMVPPGHSIEPMETT